MVRIRNLVWTLLIVGFLMPFGPSSLGDHTEPHPVRPGDRMTAGSAGCTLSFVFDGQGAQSGEVFYSTAAHCVSHVGQNVATDTISHFATVAYIQPGGSRQDDFAFLRVDPEHHDRVEPDVRGHDGYPVGTASQAETSIGHPVQFSGYGLGFSSLAQTRQNRVGALWSDTGATYLAEGPVIWGDSGGPILHVPSGKSLGIVSALVIGCCAGPGAALEGPTVRHMMDEAAGNGFQVDLRTA